MLECIISEKIKNQVPDFKLGLITYNDITVSQSPKMFRGRFQMYQAQWQLELEDKNVADLPGIKIWRETFKTLGIDPSRYRPSQEALYRRLKKGSSLPEIHSAADVNNLASIQYQIPMGIYDLDQIHGTIRVEVDREEEGYDAINGRYLSMKGKLFTRDDKGAFGSPIVDSRRSMATENTQNALQVVYLKRTITNDEAHQLMPALIDLFTFIHGGNAEYQLIF